MIRRRWLLLLAFLVAVPVALALLFERVPPSTIGVKQTLWGGGGVVEEDYTTGVHLGITGFHVWHLLPARTHFLHFTGGEVLTSAVDIQAPSMEVRNKDGNEVSIDLSIPYRIRPGEGHQIIQEGLKHSYADRVKSTAERVLRSELAQLTSEEMQDTGKRLQMVERILPILNRELADFHVVADALLIRQISFPREYENKLQEKQYLRQKAKLGGALTLQANEEKTTNLIERQIVAAEKKLQEDWEKRLQEKRSEYEVILAGIRAEAEVYSRRTRAEGDAALVIHEATGRLAIEKAEALRDELRTAALDSRGGRILLGLEAARNLQIREVTLDSQDPAVPLILDLDALTRLLIGGGEEPAPAGEDGGR